MRFTRRSLLLSAGGVYAWQPSPVTILTRQEETSVSALACAGETIALTATVKAGEPALILSTDGGAAFTHASLPEAFHSLFLCDETSFWGAGPSGLWHSPAAGRGWTLRYEAPGIRTLCFAGPGHGFAAGEELTLLETRDNGTSWNAVDAGRAPDVNPGYAAYHWIHFVNPRVGIICGASHPPRAGYTSPLPAWRDPLIERRRRELPHASITLETRDGGRSWKHSVTSLFGSIGRVRYSSEGRGLALIEFHDRFEYPSEVFTIDLRSGASSRAFRDAGRAVTDLLFLDSGAALLAAVEPPENPARSTRGPLHLLTSADLATWSEIPVPAHVAAGRAFAAASPGGYIIATDNGFVLRFRPSSGKVR